MWWEEPAEIDEYFERIEEEGEIPEESVLGETYHVLDQERWGQWQDEWREEGKDSGIDIDGKAGTAYPGLIEGEGVIVVDNQMDELEVRATAIHEETHIATLQNNRNTDIFNQEGVAYARENFFREQNGLDRVEPPYRPLVTRVANQWTESYINAAEELGDETALNLARESFKYEPSVLEKIATPLKNPYVETFDEKVNQMMRQ